MTSILKCLARGVTHDSLTYLYTSSASIEADLWVINTSLLDTLVIMQLNRVLDGATLEMCRFLLPAHGKANLSELVLDAGDSVILRSGVDEDCNFELTGRVNLP